MRGKCNNSPCSRSHDTTKALCTICHKSGHVSFVCPAKKAMGAKSVQFLSLALDEFEETVDVDTVLDADLLPACPVTDADPSASVFAPPEIVTAELDTACAQHLLRSSLLAPDSIHEAPLRRFRTANGSILES